MALRTGVTGRQTARAKRGRTTGATTALRIDRNAALRMSPLELRNALELERIGAVDFHLDPSDQSDLAEDEVDVEDMEGDEFDDEESLEGDQEAAAESVLGMGPVGSTSPFLDCSHVYLITVVQGGTDQPPFCRFDAPGWFDRVRSRHGRQHLRRVGGVLNALASLMSEEFPGFLLDPSPAQFGWAEWQLLDRRKASLSDSILVRKGLARRLRGRLERADAVDDTALGGLLPHVWILWPQGPGGSETPAPLTMPVTTLYSKGFQLEAAAALCLAGFTAWRLSEAGAPAVSDARRRAARPFAQLDQRERLHTAAALVRVSADELLEVVSDLATSRDLVPEGAS